LTLLKLIRGSVRAARTVGFFCFGNIDFHTVFRIAGWRREVLRRRDPQSLTLRRILLRKLFTQPHYSVTDPNGTQNKRVPGENFKRTHLEQRHASQSSGRYFAILFVFVFVLRIRPVSPRRGRVYQRREHVSLQLLGACESSERRGNASTGNTLKWVYGFRKRARGGDHVGFRDKRLLDSGNAVREKGFS
jgi:hypothetical protein